MTEYDFKDTLQHLDAGVFDQKLSHAVKDVATSVVCHGDSGKKGKVTIELTLQRIGESMQVEMSHKLKYEKPTAKGKAIEENTTSTPLHVNSKGLSFLPHDQIDAFGQEEQ